jgi:CCR4-NOT transcription complex subunit 1
VPLYPKRWGVHTQVRAAQSVGEAALAVAQKVFKRLYEGPAGGRLHITTHLALLEHIRDVHQRLVKELTTWVLYSDEERKLHQEIAEGLVRARLLQLTEFDSHVAKLMNAGRHAPATQFASRLVHQCILAEPLATASDFYAVLDVLAKVAQRPGADPALAQLVEQVRARWVTLRARWVTLRAH